MYLLILLLVSLPAVQRWLGGVAARKLSKELNIEVHVGNLRLGLFNRLVADDVILYDQQGDTLLSAARVGAKAQLRPLFSGKVRLANVQLFGFNIHLKKSSARSPYNVQFVIDKLSNPDSDEPSNMDLAISSAVIRRGTITHDLIYKPIRTGFDIAHLRLSDISIKASLKRLTSNSATLAISHLSFTEANSGLRIEGLMFNAIVDDGEARVNEFTMRLPHSSISVPQLTAHFDGQQIQDAAAEIESTLTPADLAAFVPQLDIYTDALSLNAKATLNDTTLDIPTLSVTSSDLRLLCNGSAQRLSSSEAISTELDLQELYMSQKSLSQLQQLIGEAPVNLEALGATHAEGHFTAVANSILTDASIDCQVQTAIGDIDLKGTLADADQFQLDVHTSELSLTTLFNNDSTNLYIPHCLAIDTQVEGSWQQLSARGQAELKGIEWMDRTISNVQMDFGTERQRANLTMSVSDPDYALTLNADLTDTHDFTKDEDILNNISGTIELTDVSINDPQLSIALQRLWLNMDNSSAQRSISLRSDFVDLDAQGRFNLLSLAESTQQILHRALPSLIPTPQPKSDYLYNDIKFDIFMQHPDPLLQLAGLDMSVPKQCRIAGQISSPQGMLTLHATAPQLLYGNEDLRDITIVLDSRNDSLQAEIEMLRTVKSGLANLGMAAVGGHDRLLYEAVWDVPSTPVIRGTLTADTHFSRDRSNNLAADIQIRPTNISIGDTIWHVRQTDLTLSQGVLDVNNMQIEHGDAFLRLGGKASARPDDQLWIELEDINLGYILDFIHIGGVDLEARVSGTIIAHHLFSHPMIEANVLARDFAVNGCVVGDTRAHGGWERHDANTIDIDAYITDPATEQRSHAKCIIHPGHRPDSGIDLQVDAHHLSAAFVGRYTQSFLKDFAVAVTGDVHLYGPFGALDLAGNAQIDTAFLTVPSLGVRYVITDGLLNMHPGRVELSRVQVHDLSYQNGNRHSAILAGAMTYDHFRDIAYDIIIDATDMLCYDFRDFGDMPFYATVFATGNAHLRGNTSHLLVELQGQPTAGSVLTYNATSPENTTDNQFIRWKQKTPAVIEDPAQAQDAQATTSTTPQHSWDAEQSGIDMRINMDLDVQPDATIGLLMDQRTGDMISLNGRGNLKASYHNRGTFQLYGVYHVERGTYRLSMQNLIRKEFLFQRGGTLTFGGQPLQAALDLQAIYTVPSVSLNDLAAGSNISNSNVRVNCIMNIGGSAEHPRVSFDFDIPNVNEDEKQMVRSLISTEEERNLQVIYLLGIGRFYTYDYTAEQSQASTAMNGLLSSTLSGQLNNLLTNAIGTNASWNFGTNLSTGQQGWNEVDVEGMLSGRLLNNRLIFNGTFGYRDRPMTASNTNFVGDFDLQYQLTRSGNISLKAYSETNDRYFTKSALTTQGVGILLRKDFNSVRDLLHRK